MSPISPRQFQLTSDSEPDEFEHFKEALLTEIGRLIKDFDCSSKSFREYNHLDDARRDLQVSHVTDTQKLSNQNSSIHSL